MNPYRLKCWCLTDAHGNVIDRRMKDDDEGVVRPCIFQKEMWARRQMPYHPGCLLVECEAVITAVCDTPQEVIVRTHAALG